MVCIGEEVVNISLKRDLARSKFLFSFNLSGLNKYVYKYKIYVPIIKSGSIW